jgi:AbrB family looped-hinge helix DNA binding protein
MKSTVSERGQVTIPKPIRDKLGLGPGQEMEFEARGGLLIGRKKTVKDVVARVTGIIGPLDVDRFLSESRGPAWSEREDANRR